jgi:hypothetical protein
MRFRIGSQVKEPQPTSYVDLRDDFIRRVVAGHSFADVGGLWGTVNEKVSVAANAGAASVAMIDVAEPGAELWSKFRDRLAGLGLPECPCISGNICELSFSASRPVYDVVHCSGVLYHHPNPMLMIEALRRITKKHLILTSSVTQQTIRNELGTYTVPPSGVVFVPALNDSERQILAKYWAETARAGTCYGISEPARWDTSDFDPWWFLPTPTAMTAMATCCRFRVVDSGPHWNNNAFTVLLEAIN